MADDQVIKAVANYERLRKEVSVLSRKRADLFSECELEKIDRPMCLRVAHDDLKTVLNENYGTGYTYDEILEDSHLEGRCCDRCYESYQIKKGPLSEARQKFGHAKRSLSRIGKRLLKGQDLSDG